MIGYDSYQDDDKQPSKGLASESQDVSKQVAATKNDKKEKNENNEKNTSANRVPYQKIAETRVPFDYGMSFLYKGLVYFS